MSRGDLTEVEWRILSVLLPVEREPGKRGRGRPPKDNRNIINGILWRLRTGAPWRDVPEKFVNWNSIYRRFRRWSASGVWESVAVALAETMAAWPVYRTYVDTNSRPVDESDRRVIERSIQESDLGLTPSNDGKIIRLPIPQLTEERRKELVKVVRGLAEEGRVAVRNVRRDVMHHLKELVRALAARSDVLLENFRPGTLQRWGLGPVELRDFRLLWAGEGVSLLGDQFHFVALATLVFALTGSGLAMGTVLVAAAIPRAALMVFGGALTDRFSPRSLMFGSNVLRSVVVGTPAILVLSGETSRGALEAWPPDRRPDLVASDIGEVLAWLREA